MAQNKVEIQVKLDDQASGGLRKLDREMQNVSKTSEDTSRAFKTMGTALTGIAVGFGAFTASTIKAAAQLEQTEAAFSTLAGSEEEARMKLKELSDFAVKTPFQIQEVEENAFLLSAMGVEMDNLIPTMRMLGDVSRGQSDVFGSLALNYGQVLTQGKLTGRELRDFAIRGIPLLDMLSETLGKTKEEITDMVSAGDITSDLVTEAFQSMSSEGGKFFNFMEKQSQTFNGVMSNIKDNFTRLQRAIGEEFLPILKPIAKAFQGFMDQLVNANPIVKKLIAIVLGLVTALAGIGGPALLLIGFLPQITAGFALVSTAMSGVLGPIGLVIAGLAALFLAWQKNLFGIQDVTAEVFGWLKTQLGILIGFFKARFDELFPVAKEAFEKISGFIKEHWDVIKAALDVYIMFFKLAWEKIKFDLTAAWEIFKFTIATALDAIFSIVQAGLQLITGDFSGAWETIVGLFDRSIDRVKNLWTNLWTALKESAVKGLEAVKNGILAPINWIKNQISGLLGSIGGAEEATRGAFSGSFGAPVVGSAMGNILKGGFQAFANGGVVKQPTLGLIGEGNQNEAVVPLPDGRRIPVEGKVGGDTNVTINFGDVMIRDENDIDSLVDRIKDVFIRDMKLSQLSSQ